VVKRGARGISDGSGGGDRLNRRIRRRRRRRRGRSILLKIGGVVVVVTAVATKCITGISSCAKNLPIPACSP